MLTYSILPASLWDLKGILRLERICFGSDAWPILDVVGMLTFPGELRLKAIQGTKIIGFAAGEYSWEEGAAVITTIGVDTDFRRQGVGAALLDACEKGLPGKKIHLTVKEGNQAAMSLYEKNGYRVISRIPHYYQKGETGLLMEKVRGKTR